METKHTNILLLLEQLLNQQIKLNIEVANAWSAQKGNDMLWEGKDDVQWANCYSQSTTQTSFKAFHRVLEGW